MEQTNPHNWAVSFANDLESYAQENDLPVFASVMQIAKKSLLFELDLKRQISERKPLSPRPNQIVERMILQAKADTAKMR